MTTAIVPCNGCTHCCRNELLVLHPENGDDVDRYETQDVINPITGLPGVALKNKPNGDCHYLGDNGCTIHAYRPALCREFDCRRAYQFFMMNPKRQRREWVARFPGTREQMEVGRKMLEKHPL